MSKKRILYSRIITMEDESILLEKKGARDLTKNLIGFWLLGLANNFGYVVMLSTAHDILTPPNAPNSTYVNRSDHLIENCNPIGTGAVLLADILPALLIKIIAPMLLHKVAYLWRVSAVVTFSALSYVLVSAGGSNHVVVGLVGVVFASASCGLGETTFLGLISHFNKNVISTWSSGTGAAGLLGAISYALMTSLGMSPKITLLIMLVIPAIMAVSYFFILVPPTKGLLRATTLRQHQEIEPSQSTESLNTGLSPGSSLGEGINKRRMPEEDLPHAISDEMLETDINLQVIKNFVKDNRTPMEKFTALKPLLKYMIPLFLVFLIEYVINQALFELIIFKDTWLGVPQQYRWYLVMYQLGVFLSRSSINILQVPFTWLFPSIQLTIFLLLFLQIFFHYITSIIIVFIIIIVEGVISGGAYVNTFFAILHSVDARDKEMSMSVTCISDSLGITFAALLSIQLHNFMCSL